MRLRLAGGTVAGIAGFLASEGHQRRPGASQGGIK